MFLVLFCIALVHNKLSWFYASILLLIIKFVITLLKYLELWIHEATE